MKSARSSAVALRWAAAASHLSAVVAAITAIAVAGKPAIWAGMVAFLGPLLARLTLGCRDAFVRRHAVAALSFNMSVAVYLGMIAAGLQLTARSPYTIQFVPFLLFLNMIIAFNWLVFTCIAVHRAATGQHFTYPLTIRPAASRARAGRLLHRHGVRSPSSNAPERTV
jgi:uncharacterized Tic20 family protein